MNGRFNLYKIINFAFILFMKHPAILSAQSLIQLCKSSGVEAIVISPGSRNAPLTLGFNLDSFFKTYSVVDERCASFFALGIAQQTQNPVAIVCTSGSALLNYYPAIAEAYYQQVPLLIISADRPASKIDIGDGQTIRQANVFQNHVHCSVNLAEDDCLENHQSIQMAIDSAKINKGPVHINIPFEEPLYELTDQLGIFHENLLQSDLKSNHNPSVEISDIQAEIWQQSAKKLVLIGEMPFNCLDQNVIDFLANDPSIVVMTETTSNVYHPHFLNKIDVMITPFSETDFQNFKPELLITIGGMLVSKRIKTFLRKYQPEKHWHVDLLRAYDTFGCLTHHFKAKPNDFFKSLFELQSIDSDYQSKLLAVKQDRELAHNQFVNQVTFSDFQAFDLILKEIPSNIQLQISNSSSIRYLQLFDLKQHQIVYCNRGTSGIDGSTSTAIGAAVGSQKETLLITGDLSFFYDSNALWNNYIPKNFKIIIMNNSGGGIFRILPGHQENDIFNTFFETSHQLSAKHLAKMYDFDYFEASNESSVLDGCRQLFNSEKPSILEIFTPEKLNDAVLKSYFSFLNNI